MKTYVIEFEGIETEYVELEIGEGQFTSMPKSVYDAQQEAAKDAAN